jgi:Mg2+ and Co2+ transporter CorA
LFGVSLSNIPLSDDPNAFWILVGMLVVLIAAEVALFRWTRWL